MDSRPETVSAATWRGGPLQGDGRRPATFQKTTSDWLLRGMPAAIDGEDHMVGGISDLTDFELIADARRWARGTFQQAMRIHQLEENNAMALAEPPDRLASSR